MKFIVEIRYHDDGEIKYVGPFDTYDEAGAHAASYPQETTVLPLEAPW